jgi:hypothetical protein
VIRAWCPFEVDIGAWEQRGRCSGI